MARWKLRYFSYLNLVEGSSLLILLFVAMPYRAITHNTDIVRLTGSIHGIVFLMYFVTAVTIGFEFKWTFKKTMLALVVASLPFGSFWFERKYLKPDISE